MYSNENLTTLNHMQNMNAITAHDAHLVPDESRWGQGYGGRAYTPVELDTIAFNVAPTLGVSGSDRLHADDAGFAWTSPRTAQVPAGFDVDEHPNRRGVDPALLDPAPPTDPAAGPLVDARLQNHFRARGWDMDQNGRPLHPHAAQLLADPRIGLPTSLGFAYYLGESVVADAVAVAGDRVVLTTRATRHEGLIPSLPGGYGVPADEARTNAQWRDGDRPATVEGIITAARRKLAEETGLQAPADSHAEIVRAIRPVSSVHTLNAWTVVYTVRFDLPARTNLTLRPDSTARWFPLATLGFMWPDHRAGLVAALAAA